VAIQHGRSYLARAYEINGLMARLYAEKWGSLATVQRYSPDDPELIRQSLVSNLDADMIILIGGTSVGEKDYPEGLDGIRAICWFTELESSLASPTAFGRVQGKAVVLPTGGIQWLLFLIFTC